MSTVDKAATVSFPTSSTPSSRRSTARSYDVTTLTSFNPFPEEDENDQPQKDEDSPHRTVKNDQPKPEALPNTPTTSIFARIQNSFFTPPSSTPYPSPTDSPSSLNPTRARSTSSRTSTAYLTANRSLTQPPRSLTPDLYTLSRKFIPRFPTSDDHDTRSIRTVTSLRRSDSASKITKRIREEGLSRDYWIDDDQCKECYGCMSVFTTFRRKHHCRICGQIFCFDCASNMVESSRFGHPGVVRVCNLCLEKLRTADEDEDSDQDSVLPRSVERSASLSTVTSKAIPKITVSDRFAAEHPPGSSTPDSLISSGLMSTSADSVTLSVTNYSSEDEELPENLKGVATRLAAAFSDVQQYRRLLSCRNSDAQRLLDTFQVLLDTPGLSAKFRSHLLVATQRLSKCAGLYPTCYNLKDVKLESEDPVAAGSFADIYKGRLLGQTVCLKVIRLYQTSHVASFVQQLSSEAILWGQLSHPNLLPIYGLYQYTAGLCLVSPWMEHGDVISFLEEHSDVDRSLLVLDVASGTEYLHSHDIVHGDLKGANILVSDVGRACLADFGLSAVSDANILHWTSHSSAASKGGSIRWQAPELFDYEGDDIVYNTKPSDVYAFSCVAYEIFTGDIPFHEVPRDATVMRKVQAGAQPSRPPPSSPAWDAWGLTEPHWSLMTACWSARPSDRPTMQDIVAQLAATATVDNRPVVGKANSVSRAHFRDSVSAQAELPSVGEIEAMLDGMSRADSTLRPSWSWLPRFGGTAR